MMEIKSLKEIASLIRTGKTPPTKEDKYFNGEINWYSPGDLDKTKYLFTAKRTITQQAIEDKKAITFPKDTLLVGCIGDIGKLGITSELSSSNQQLTGILPNNETNVSYLYYWFKGNKKVLENYSNNAVVPILNNRTLETVKIPLPPLDQQKKIAAILDAADAYRQKTKALIEKYDELTQSLFLDMFGDPVTNPKGWDKIKLGDLHKISSGGTPSRKRNDYYENGTIPWVKTGDLKGLYVLKPSESITEEALKNSSAKLFPSDTLLIAMYGATIGACSILNFNASTNQACAALLPSDKVNILFEIFFFREFKKELIKMGVGGAQPNISAGLLKNLKIYYPPIDLQNQFAERVQAIEAQKAQAQASLVQSEDLFHSLLQRAFKGELTATTSPAIDTF